jgi:3-methylfumaryl-CoA hydratase
MTDFAAWIGRTREASDLVTPRLMAEFGATFAPHLAPVADGIAPPALHWCLAPETPSAASLGPDGHAAKGGFLPPVPLPRRMWAGGQIETLADLRVGDRVTRTETVRDVAFKAGRSGRLAFVTVDHAVATERGVAIRERQDIVYREMTGSAPAAGKAPPPPPKAQHRETHVSDPVLLFRYSALTFNGHRIHYDRDYVTKVEGYPGLIFHGPLQAALIVEMAAKLRGGKAPKKFTYRGVQPLFEGSEFSINASDNGAGGMDVWVANAEGQPTMKGVATW